ncbi:MAG: hypothetical protein ALECFALPRED_004904 [Alectoria fallacina]|uniref:Rhodopsin domain-containing protein n=1 Tax=Alectoria fallacina TaxID=1903189 RepID=A0A8H3ENI3_9LECA|nr:MAG: hypothetical protein ALECFALPRED_004904 [Alectoria fallacina]
MANPLAGLTPAELAQTPALMPPAGVVPNFINPPGTLEAVTNATMAICFTFTTIFVLVRLLTKYCVDRAFLWEDWCCLVAWMGILAFGSVILDAQSQGAGRHQWDVNAINAVKVARTSNVGSIIYGPIIAIAKLAILLQYKRLFVAHKHNFVFYGVHVLIWTNLVFYIIETFLEIFACTPREKIWNPLTPGHCIGIENNYIAVGAWNVLSDFSILILPMVAIWNLQMANTRKIGVAAVFATGLFACVASVVRLAYTVDLLYTSDGTYSIIKVGLWNVGELTTIILCACFPIMPKFLQWITGKNKNKATYHKSAYANGYGLKGHNSKRSNQFSNPMVSNNTAPWLDSEDHDLGLVGKTKGNYHNLDVGQTYVPNPAPIRKVEPAARLKGGAPANSIWKTNTVRVDTSLDPERGGYDFV